SALHPLFLCSHQPSWQQSRQPSWQQSHQHSWQQSDQLPGSNLISFIQLQLWLVRDAFTPGCHRILSSHGPFIQHHLKHAVSSSCSLNSNSEC
ncbi:unnamed protein product, partial [Staurois parvus]